MRYFMVAEWLEYLGHPLAPLPFAVCTQPLHPPTCPLTRTNAILPAGLPFQYHRTIPPLYTTQFFFLKSFISLSLLFDRDTISFILIIKFPWSLTSRVVISAGHFKMISLRHALPPATRRHISTRARAEIYAKTNHIRRLFHLYINVSVSAIRLWFTHAGSVSLSIATSRTLIIFISFFNFLISPPTMIS
jgi:hypothetical protein